MKIRKYILLVLVLFMFSVENVLAEECDTNYMLEMKELAKNIDYEYEYIGDYTDYQLYKLTFNNIDSRLYLRNSKGNIYISSSNNSINVSSGKTYFRVYSSMCSSNLLTIDIDLPRFNEFSQYEECNDLEDKVDVCDKWYQGVINENKFYEIIDKYYADEKQKQKEFISSFFEGTNLYYTVGIIIGLIIVIYIIYRIKKKNSYLT